MPETRAMKPGDLVKVVKGTVRRGEVGTLVQKEFVAVLGLIMWNVSFDGGMQDGLYEEDELRKV